MNKQFVTYEIALKLKELGFDEPCIMFYYESQLAILGQFDSFKHSFRSNSEHTSIEKESEKFVSAPLWQQVIDWFRVKHNIGINITENGDDILDYVAEKDASVVLMQFRWFFTNKRDCNYDAIGNATLTYEEAREKAILKAIELISNTDEK
jgi:hypothetical protein